MSKFREGQRVVTIVDSELKEGVIVTLYETAKVAIVKFDDRHVEKVHFSDLSIPPQKESEPVEPVKVVEKSEITITPAEFREICTSVAVEESKGNDLIGFAFAIFSAKLHSALFLDEGDND